MERAALKWPLQGHFRSSDLNARTGQKVSTRADKIKTNMKERPQKNK